MQVKSENVYNGNEDKEQGRDSTPRKIVEGTDQTK